MSEITDDYIDDPNVHRWRIRANAAQLDGSGSIQSNAWLITDLPDAIIDSDDSRAEVSGAPTVRFSTDEDGENQIGCHIVNFTPAAGGFAGGAAVELWINPGTYEGGADLDLWIWWITGGSQTQPAAGATYGKNSVYGSNVAGTWKDDDYTDATSNGNHGTPSNMVLASDSPFGSNLNSFEFDGSTSLITVGDDPSLDLSAALTMQFWFKIHGATGTWQQLLTKRQTTTYNYGIHAQPPSGDVTLQYYSSDFRQIIIAWTGNFAYNTWYHMIAQMEDTGNVRLEMNVDGSFVVSGLRSGDLSPNAIALLMGATNPSSPIEFLDGQLKAVTIYNTTLSEDQKTTLDNNQSDQASFWDTTAAVEDDPFGGGDGGGAGSSLRLGLRLGF